MFCPYTAREEQGPALGVSQDSHTKWLCCSPLHVHIHLQVTQNPADVQIALESSVSQQAPGPQSHLWVSLSLCSGHTYTHFQGRIKKETEGRLSPLHGCVGEAMPSGNRKSCAMVLSPPDVSTQLLSHCLNKDSLSPTCTVVWAVQLAVRKMLPNSSMALD